MSYIYDELLKLREYNPGIFKQVSRDLGVNIKTIPRWKKREPHQRWKPRLLDYIEKEKEKIIDTTERTRITPSVTTRINQQELNIEYNEYDLPIDFIDKLKTIYLSDKVKGVQEWDRESPRLIEIVKAIAKNIKNHEYEILSPIATGGTAVIIKIRHERLGVLRALKFPRPIGERLVLFGEIIKSEIAHLLEATHINIMEIFDTDIVEVDGSEYPYYIMSYIEGAQDGIDYFNNQQHDSRDFISVLKQVIEGIKHLHSLGIAHLDIKPDNFLISPNGRAVLSDLGSARKITGQDDDDVLVIYTRDYAHPTLISKVVSSSTDPNRVKGSLKRSELSYKYDLYALGKSIIKILKNFDPVVTGRMPPYCRKYLDLLACRALDGKNSTEDPLERAMGLPRLAFDELKYVDINDISTDLLKLSGEWPIERLLPELDPHFPSVIQTTSYSKTPLTNRLSKSISHPVIQRLSGVSQLGLLIQVYPTATHSRLEHSLGVFTNTIQYVYSLYNDPINPLFKQIMNENDIKSMLVAALCHDIGQFPLAHDLHEALPDIFNHEEIAIDLLEGNTSLPYQKSFLDIISDNDCWGVDPKYVAEILKANPSNVYQPIKARILHTIIDGPIDTDKLDYLIRDANNLGIPYASLIDYSRLLTCLTIVFSELEQRLHAALGIHEKGKIPAEAIAFARYAMFGTVYWHHTNRAAVSMLHRAVWEIFINQYASVAREREFKREFIDYFFKPERTIALQLDLTQITDKTLSQLTQLSPTDYELINWLYLKSGQHSLPAAKLLKMINERDLFKRILVLSQKRHPTLWDKLIRFRRSGTIDKYVTFQREVQKGIVNSVQRIDDSLRRTNSILTLENTDKVIHLDEQGDIFITVDIPLDRPSAAIGLEYLPEADRQDVLEQWNLPHRLEGSTIWSELNDNFTESIGKIRVFGYEEIAEIIRAAIPRPQLEDILESSLGRL
ncbi:protein kinase [Chloroflexota bacterium]